MASEIRSRWEQSRKPPELPTHHQKRPSQYGHISGAMGDINVVYNPMDEPTNHSRDASQSETGAVSHGTHNPGGRAQSPTVDDGINDTIQDLLKSLVSRGKGNHICPFGYRCRKGGVDSNGEMVIFERNSVFRHVLTFYLYAEKPTSSVP